MPAILVVDGVFDLGLAALTDTLSTANELAGSLPDAPAPIELTRVGVHRFARRLAMAHLDLALGVLRGRSPALAALAARYLLVEARGSQADFVIPDHLAHADPIVERLETWARGS